MAQKLARVLSACLVEFVDYVTICVNILWFLFSLHRVT